MTHNHIQTSELDMSSDITNFNEWNDGIKKQLEQIQMHRAFFSDTDDAGLKPATLTVTKIPKIMLKKPAKWEQLLAVTNSEFLILKSNQILENYQKQKSLQMNINITENMLNIKIAYIISNLHCISKQYEIPWIYIYNDVHFIADFYQHKLDFTLRCEQQIVALLILYFKNNKTFPIKNEYIREIMRRLVTSIKDYDLREVFQSIQERK